jgi:hypothetical protein
MLNHVFPVLCPGTIVVKGGCCVLAPAQRALPLFPWETKRVSMTLIYTVRLNKKFLPFDRITAFHEATWQKFGATLQI